MLTSNVNPNTASNANAALYTNSATTTSSTTDAAAQQDRFLKLLVAQLNNQDPMNPMDNAQMTSQMAQINTVTGIQQVNEAIKSMATQFSAMQVLQGASMIGREVLTEGNLLAVKNGVGQGAVDLAGKADKVTVTVMSPGGQTLGTINLGPQEAGRINFDWDASTYTGSGSPIFKSIATLGTASVSSTTLTRGTIESVGTDSKGMTLTLKGLGTIAYGDVKSIL
jgi:flagellar basal-body rod modification protein FlgD